MLQYLLMCKSLTYAQRASRLIENNGISAILTKIPKSATDNGCNYGIKVSERRLADTLQILNYNGFGPVRVLMVANDGTISEVTP